MLCGYRILIPEQSTETRVRRNWTENYGSLLYNEILRDVMRLDLFTDRFFLNVAPRRCPLATSKPPQGSIF